MPRRFESRDTAFVIGMCFAIISVFLLSDNLYYAQNGIYVMDDLHPDYELSISNSLDSMFPVKDMSYDGKELKYHFGYPIMLYQLVNDFSQNPLKLVYLIIPSFLIFLFIIFLIEASRDIEGHYSKALFMLWVLFSSISLSLYEVYYLLNKVGGFSISGIGTSPLNIFSSITLMGSHGFCILLVTALLFLLKNKKKSVIIECTILTGIAMFKSTFFVPIAVAYALVSLINFLLGEKSISCLSKCLSKLWILMPGAAYMLLFVAGAHKHTLWAIFPGSLNIASTTLPIQYLLINALISPFIQSIFIFGVGILFLYPETKKFISRLKTGPKRGDKAADPMTYPILIIFTSLFFAIFFSEVTESDNMQFVYPGYIILSILSYKYILTNKKLKRFMPLFLILILFNAAMSVGFWHIAPSDKSYNLNYNDNALANIKINLIKKTLSTLGLRISDYVNVDGFFFSDDLINGLNKLSKERGTFVFSRLYETAENKKIDYWRPDGFMRTALSKNQALIEQHKYKGILTEQDYPERSLYNIYFYLVITGKEESINQVNLLFNQSPLPKYEDLSYYPYLRLFSDNNYYSYNDKFFDFMHEKTKHMPSMNKDEFLVRYLDKACVSYIMFERGEKPLGEYASLLKLDLIYESGTVRIYSYTNLSSTCSNG